MTNCEKITRSVDSLVEFLTNHDGIFYCDYCDYYRDYAPHCTANKPCNEYCYKATKNFLESEVE